MRQVQPRRPLVVEVRQRPLGEQLGALGVFRDQPRVAHRADAAAVGVSAAIVPDGQAVRRQAPDPPNACRRSARLGARREGEPAMNCP
jgi:hypothetical protein